MSLFVTNCHLQCLNKKILNGIYQFPRKNSGKGYDFWEIFQIGSIILKNYARDQKTMEKIDDFEQFGLEIHKFQKIFIKKGGHCPNMP